MFESLYIIKYWSCQARKRESMMIWKKWKKKNAKILSEVWHQNVLTEMFTITEKSALSYKKVKFLTSPN